MVITSGFHNTLELSLLRFVLVLIVIALYFALYGFERIRKIMLLTLSYLTILNLVLQLFARSSVESVVGPTGWFLTGSNALVSYTMPTVCLAIVSIEKKKQIWFSILSIAVCLYTAIISTTATTIFVLFLIVGVWSFQKAINMNLIKINWVVTIIVLGFFILVVFQVQEKIFLIKFIVEDVLQRDMSFTSRTFVWSESFHQIIQSPIIGHGSPYSFHVNVNVDGVGFWVDHAHNHYLQQLVQGGIIQLLLFILIIYEVLKKIKRMPGKVIAWGIVSLLIMGIMFLVESYTNVIIYSIIYLIYAFCDEYFASMK